MATKELEAVSISIPAREAALAWLNAFMASYKGDLRPILNQTISIEVFDRGVQFIATNGHILFRTWVPKHGEPITTFPPERTRPRRQLTVMDPDGFGKGFLAALLRLTGQEEHANEMLTITSASADDDAAPSFGQEFQTERVILRACGQRLDLLVRDEKYPDWRKLRLGFDDMALVDGMKVQPKYLALIGKLKDITAVDMTFAGSDRAIYFDAGGTIGKGVKGLLMPMRRLETSGADDVEDDDEPFPGAEDEDDGLGES